MDATKIALFCLIVLMFLILLAIVELRRVFDKANIIETRYQTLKEKIDALPQSILHQAFQGKLVPQLDSDGDAKDLLREISALRDSGYTQSDILGMVAEEKGEYERK